MSFFVLGGCEKQKTNTTILATVAKEGMLTIKSGEVYLLSTTEGIVNITSTKIDLDNYLKQKIKVTGMFSGDTLYVDTIE